MKLPFADIDLAPVLSRRISVLGSTGSIGVSTLDVIRHVRARYGAHAFDVESLTAQKNVADLAKQAREVGAKQAVIGDASLYGALKEALSGSGIEAAAGKDAIREAAMRPADMVMAGIVGAAGVAPVLEAVRRGAIVALANKECVVAAGAVFRKMLDASRSVLIPVDSEHNAVFQLLDFGEAKTVEKVMLTASGGPFRTWPMDRIKAATPEEAVSHPTWSMGAKISVDSATLMNKGLELIEAHILFGLEPRQLEAIVHPQSIVHCLVCYADGSVLAQMGAPDMRTPISNAMGWPRRVESPSRRLDFGKFPDLTFEKPDLDRFPCLNLAMDCLQMGGAAPTILNAANEIAVEQFLGRQVGFLGIARTVERTLEAMAREMRSAAPETLDDVMALDAAARIRAAEAAKQVCLETV